MDLIALLRHSHHLHRLTPDETLWQQGDTGDDVYVVLEGVLRCEVNKRTLQRCEAGDVLGELALIGVTVRSMTVVAETSACLARLDAARLQALLEAPGGFER